MNAKNMKAKNNFYGVEVANFTESSNYKNYMNYLKFKYGLYGVEVDLLKAFVYLKKAADGGYELARLQLAAASRDEKASLQIADMHAKVLDKENDSLLLDDKNKQYNSEVSSIEDIPVRRFSEIKSKEVNYDTLRELIEFRNEYSKYFILDGYMKIFDEFVGDRGVDDFIENLKENDKKFIFPKMLFDFLCNKFTLNGFCDTPKKRVFSRFGQ